MVDASDTLLIYDLGLHSPNDTLARLLYEVELPGLGTVGTHADTIYDKEIFYSYESFVVPSKTFRLNLDTFQSEFIREVKIPGHYGKSDEYITDQVWYTSKDGTRVPMFVTRRKETLSHVYGTTRRPVITHLNAYGGFGVSQQPEFDPTILPIINDLDGIHVVANIRGGGEFGDEWHTAAIREKRQNGFDDFIAAAEYLIAKGWTDSEHLFIQGGSNGGTLVTAVANQRPQLFAGVIGQVPVTDMMRYQKFTGGFMWADEYGSAEQGAVNYLI
jgi:prolyl oligopeptidase